MFSNLQGCKKKKKKNGQAPVTMSGQTCYARMQAVSGRSNFKGGNCCDREPRLNSNPFITKKQLYPQAAKSFQKSFEYTQLKRRCNKVSGSELQKEHLSSVMYPILYNLVLVYRIELRTLY